MILPRGYSGADHRLLLREDIQRDLNWSVTNQWGSGIQDLYPNSNIVVFPRYPDRVRSSIRSLYEECRHSLLLSCGERGNGTEEFLLRAANNTYTRLAGIQITKSSRSKRRALIRRAGKSPIPSVIHIPIDDTFTPEIAEMLSALAESNISYANLTSVFSDVQGTIGEAQFPESSGNPFFGLHASAASMYGRQNSGYTRGELSAGSRNYRAGSSEAISDNATTRRRLTTMADDPKHSDSGDRISEEIEFAERVLIADMSGLVSLDDHDITARFDAGSLVDILYRGNPAMCPQRALSYYIVGSRRNEFLMRGTFSFDGVGVHGLRATQGIGGEGVAREGRVVTDYFFMENCSSLIVSMVVVYPEFMPGVVVESWAPFELPVFTYGRSEEVTVEAKLLDGEKYQLDLSEPKRAYTLSGNGFCFKNADYAMFIVYPESESNHMQLLPVKLRRLGRKRVLVASIGGSYSPIDGSQFNGYSSHTVVAIDIQKAEHCRYPIIRSDICGEAGRPWYRYSGYKTSSPL